MDPVFSPILLSQLYPTRDLALANYFLPNPLEIPPGRLKLQVYDWGTGINPVIPALKPLEVGQISRACETDYLIWGMTAFSTSAAGFLIQIVHSVQSRPRPLFSHHIINGNFAGLATNPFLMKETYPIRRGDTLMVEVKNLEPTAAATKIQVVIWTGELIPEPLKQPIAYPGLPGSLPTTARRIS